MACRNYSNRSTFPDANWDEAIREAKAASDADPGNQAIRGRAHAGETKKEEALWYLRLIQEDFSDHHSAEDGGICVDFRALRLKYCQHPGSSRCIS